MSSGSNVNGGAIDLLESNPVVAPVGTTRIARMGGVTKVSTDGSAFAALSSGSGAGTLKAVAVASANITLEDEQTIDGVAVVAGDLVLVAGQTDASENGLYTVVDSGAWTRAEDFATADQMIAGTLFSIQQGTVYGGSVWFFRTTGAITVDTTDLDIDQLATVLDDDAWFQEVKATIESELPGVFTRYEYNKVGLQPGGAALGTGAVQASVAGGGLGVANDTTYVHTATNIDPAPRTTPIAVAFRCKFTAIVAGKTSILGLAATNTNILGFGWDHGTNATKFQLFVSGGTAVPTAGNADTNWHTVIIIKDIAGDLISVLVDGAVVATSDEISTLTDSACGPASFTSSSETPGVIRTREVYAYVDPT